MLKIGITGGIGSGKTTICKIFESIGIPVFYADDEAKNILAKNKRVKSLIKEILGGNAYFRNGKPNKKYIAKSIFSDKNLLSSINQIIHPEVQLEAERWFERLVQQNKYPYALKEAALLVENGSFKKLDALIVVVCPEKIRVERVMKRDNVSALEVEKRMKNQLSDDIKVKEANYIINNDGIKLLTKQVWEIHQKLLA